MTPIEEALKALKLVIAIQENPEQNPAATVKLDPMAERQVRQAIAKVELVLAGAPWIPVNPQLSSEDVVTIAYFESLSPEKKEEFLKTHTLPASYIISKE